MSDIFSRIKKSFSSSTPSQGNILGGGKTTENEKEEEKTFDVVFTDASLGLQIQQQSDLRPAVVVVSSGSPAMREGVAVGDIIVGVEGNIVSSYEDFIAIVGALPRPITVRFKRSLASSALLPLPPSSSSSQKSTSSTSSQKSTSSNSSSSIRAGLASLMQPGSKGSGGSAPALSEEQKESRRDAMMKAAQARGEAWDKRVTGANSGKSIRVSESTFTLPLLSLLLFFLLSSIFFFFFSLSLSYISNISPPPFLIAISTSLIRIKMTEERYMTTKRPRRSAFETRRRRPLWVSY